MQIGPAAPSVSAIAGENIRDEVYSWPTIDTCTVDRRIVDQRYLEEDFFLTENVFAYGLDALEYLLFVHDLGHTCAAQVQLDGPWTGLGYEEIERRRGAYAARVAAEIARRGNELATRWSPDGDDFAALLTNPGGDSPFESESVALDDVFRAMFYIDLLTKDAKLARALGLASGCEAAPCPDLLEAPFGGMAAASVAANLRGIAQMIHGGPDASGDGFDDLLIAAGRGEVATDLLADIEAAIAQAETFDQPLQQIIVSDIAQVEALHAAVKNVTDTLKGPFVMALMLALPAEGASDND
jgi:predicted lipoprotein